MSDLNFGTWEVSESPVSIHYSLVAIEEIRHAVMEGFQKLSRGGIEVGGVLYGTREGNVNRILAIRLIQCEHALGPSFQLSDKDRAALTEQLQQDSTDPQLEGFVCLGWFVSHTRSEVVLNPSDLEIFKEYFPDLWQVTLVVRPGRGSNMRAGFFVREPDGSPRAEQSYLEFPFPDRLAGIFDRENRERPISPIRESRSQPRSTSFVREVQRPQRETPPAAAAPIEPLRQKRWHWLVVWAAGVAALAAIGTYFYFLQPPAEPIGLGVLERDGQLQIEWSHTSRPVAKARRGSLEIADGKAVPRSIELTPTELAQGTFTYQRAFESVQIRLSVESADGKKTQEAATFLGQPIKKAPEPEAEAQRAETEAEIARLRKTNTDQAGRIQQLERTLRILQTRLGAK